MNPTVSGNIVKESSKKLAPYLIFTKLNVVVRVTENAVSELGLQIEWRENYADISRVERTSTQERGILAKASVHFHERP